jgi:hypothetical protein
MPAVFDILFMFTATTRLQANSAARTATLRSDVEFAAAHEIMTLRIGTDETALVIMKSEAADRTKLPPLFRSLAFFLGRIGLVHACYAIENIHLCRALDIRQEQRYSAMTRLVVLL